MIKVTVELIPASGKAKKILGRIFIAGTENHLLPHADQSNFDYERVGEGIRDSGRVTEFYRPDGVWWLLRQVLSKIRDERGDCRSLNRLYEDQF